MAQALSASADRCPLLCPLAGCLNAPGHDRNEPEPEPRTRHCPSMGPKGSGLALTKEAPILGQIGHELQGNSREAGVSTQGGPAPAPQTADSGQRHHRPSRSQVSPVQGAQMDRDAGRTGLSRARSIPLCPRQQGRASAAICMANQPDTPINSTGHTLPPQSQPFSIPGQRAAGAGGAQARCQAGVRTDTAQHGGNPCPPHAGPQKGGAAGQDHGTHQATGL